MQQKTTETIPKEKEMNVIRECLSHSRKLEENSKIGIARLTLISDIKDEVLLLKGMLIFPIIIPQR